MRLYSKTGATVVDAPEGHFEPADDGGFDLPGPLSDLLHSAHAEGVKLWETAIEKQHRLIAEETARRSDPKALLEAVEQIIKLAQGASAPADSEAKAEVAKGTSKTVSATKSADAK